MEKEDKTHTILFFGSSGSGKSTIIRHILKKFSKCHFSVSYTTRPIREGEVNGKDYVFITKEEFQEKLKTGFFIEHTLFKGNFYGTPQGSHAPGAINIFDCDYKGVEFFKKKFPHGKFVYVFATEEIILNRLKNRKGMTDELFEHRKQTLEETREFAKTFNFDHTIETSKPLGLTLHEVDFIMQAFLV